MTTPVTDDIVSGTVTYLRSQPSALAAVSMFNIGGQLTPGIFQYRPWAKLEGSQRTCAVISYDGGWAGPNTHNTLRFPRVGVNIWADPLRDSQNNVVDPGEVMRRAYASYEAIDKVLHRTGGDPLMFGTLRVIASVRLVEPVIYMVPDGDGLVRCQASYAITQG